MTDLTEEELKMMQRALENARKAEESSESRARKKATLEARRKILEGYK